MTCVSPRRAFTRIVAMLLALHWVPHASVAGQRTRAPVRVSGSSFMYARFSTQTSSSLYAASDLGGVSLMLAMVQNFRTGYREMVGGALSTFSYGPNTVTVAVAYAHASDASYLQTYAISRLRRGGLSVAAVTAWYEPIDRDGRRQLAVNPAMILARLNPWLALGGAYALGIAAGSSAKHRAGPVVELHAPVGVITVELLNGLGQLRHEMRVALQVGY